MIADHLLWMVRYFLFCSVRGVWVAKMDRGKLRKLLVGEFTVARLIWSVVFVYVSLAIFFYLCADRMIFRPPPSSYQDGQDILKIRTEEGGQISALYYLVPNSEFTIIYSHGNAEDMGEIGFRFERFNRNGFSVLAYDYRGYGTSEGRASEAKAYQDIETVYRYAIDELKIEPNRIIAMGRSIGSGVAMHLACQHQIAGLILESPVTSAFRVITRIPLLPFDKFNNLRNIKKIDCPVLIIHGTDDRIIGIWHGRKVFEKANEPKFCLWVEKAGHNDDIGAIAGVRYWEKIREFADSVMEKLEAE